MTLDEIKRLIDFIRSQDLTEFELERAALSCASRAVGLLTPLRRRPSQRSRPAGRASHGRRPALQPAPAAEDGGAELAIVKSPIVGTFYRAPEPDAKSFVEVGDTIKKGQVLCIIEAMKLMNEIDSEYDGES